MSRPVSATDVRLAYILTGYPVASQTFIQIEVHALRQLGVSVQTFVISRSSTDECRTDADREAYATTYALRPPRPAHYLMAHLTAATCNPRQYLKAFWALMSTAGGRPSDLVRHLAYFVQGTVFWDRCRRGGVQHVHAHFANVASDVASVASMLSGGEITWSFTMHGPTELYNVDHFRLAAKASRATFAVCISHFGRSQLMALTDPEHWDKFEIVRSGVDIEAFAPSPHRDERKVTRVLCVGRLVPEKGQALLIRAVAQLLTEGYDAELILAGGGPQMQALEELVSNLGVEEQVKFQGPVGHTVVEALVRDADIFCLASFAEGIPMVFMEAMAAGKPVIGSRVMGVPELVEDGRTGLLVTPGVWEEVAGALRRLISDPEEAGRLARAGRERVCVAHDLYKNTEQLYRLFLRYASTGTAAGAAGDVALS